ncbi:FAD-dependent oxidoreductase [Candidatus Deferrimicrobium sp.]|uniref:FAD-dependent oxidoreductase n=1 Tax=Candidatus Deferrimicrobium sp. TaxID=3060586 RepID=UPI00271B0360|nr:FAD-dependent oxidoreductase [Candidatus Deferrimicrobium sp.]MDO8739079.1 FAD-dependent oxidoreductase [Candidatus Deferrimicrobium sp.]
MREYAVRPVDRSYLRENFNCAMGCPVGTQAGAYVQAIFFGEYEKAYAIARGPNPFASICGRVCAHPCEEVCRKGVVEKDPISIRAMKRFATERHGVEARHVFALGDTLRYSNAPGSLNPVKTGKRVAIIGSGPAGLTCAHDLARLGHDCTLFEAQGVAGGMLILGIPEYRLPRELVKREIDAILSMGVQIRYHAKLGRDFRLRDLREEGFDAVFVGIGSHRSHGLDIPGMDLDGVISGVDFLLNANLGYKVDLGKKVVVIGGGNVAVDVARTVRRIGDERELRKFGAVSEAREHIEAALDMARSALRMGAREVRMVCLESRENMPAWEWEIEEGLLEGIDLQCSLGPKRVLGREGKVAGLEMLRVRSLRDEQGRFNPSFHEGSELTLDADTIIYAIGQAPDLSWIHEEDGIDVTARGLVRVERESLATSAAGVYAGGDVAFGPRLIIEAVADGQRAARSIGKYLQQELRMRAVWQSTEIRHRMADDFDRTPRQKPPVIDVDRRTGISEVEVCYDEGHAHTEGSRCYRCNVNTIISSAKCILCGGCADVCPESCYRLVDVAQIRADEKIREILRARFGTDRPAGSAIIKDEKRCTRCGLCEKRCPTHAITMELFEEREALA